MTKNELEMMGVFELRVLARSCGVSCPTMKKKTQLIEEIEKIKNGEIKPRFSKKGRPPVNSGLNPYIYKIAPNHTQVNIVLCVKEYENFISLFDRLIKTDYNELVNKCETGQYEIRKDNQSIIISIKEH